MKIVYSFILLVLYSACAYSQVNIGFEQGNLSGWTITEGFNTNSGTMAGCCPINGNNAVIVGPGFDPNVGPLPMVISGGGNFSMWLGRTSGPSAKATRAAYTFNVSPSNSIFTCSYALVNHTNNDSCQHAPYFHIRLFDVSNNVIPNTDIHIQPTSTNCATADPFYQPSGTYTYRPWSFSSFDLNAYIGMAVRVEFTVGECTDGNHGSYAYIDCSFNPPPFTLNSAIVQPGQTNFFVCQSSANTFCAPPGYTYNWTGPGVTGQTTQCINIQTSGNYSVTLTQAANNITLPYNFSVVPTPSVSFSAGSSSCIGTCDGTITAGSVSGAGYNWSLTGAQNFSQGNTPSFSVNALCGTTYTLTYQETGTPLACPVSTVINLPGPGINPGSYTLTCTSPSLTVNANPTGSASALYYEWTGPGIPGSIFSQTIAVSLPGTYTLVTTNTITGCSITSTVPVSSQTLAPGFTFTTTNGGSLDCGQCITLGVASNTTVPIVGYQWMSPASPNASVFQTLNVCTAGLYTLNATAANGCATSQTIQLLPGAPQLSVTISNTITNSCQYLSDGAVEVAISPPGTYSFTWTNQSNNVISTGQNIYNLPIGTYDMLVSDGTACARYTYIVASSTVNCNSLSGNIFRDANNDCVKNNTEFNLAGIKVVANPGNYWGLSDSNGNYTIYVPPGTYSLSQIQFPNPYIGPNCTSTLTAAVSANGQQLTGLDFSDTVVNTLDGKIYALNSTNIVPGFSGNYSMWVGDNMATFFTGNFKFVKSPLLNYTYFSPAPLYVLGDTVCFAVNTLSLSAQQFWVGFSAPASLLLGTNIQACTYLTVNGIDINMANNTMCHNRVVTGSFDPNDKQVDPKGVGAEGFITNNDSVLTYHIRFQNTGTGPVVNIVITDTLSQYLNAQSLEMIEASHNYDLAILPGNVLRWKFANVMLPDSNTNEPASHGFVRYRIKQKSNNTPGTQIKNIANIYFDFNAPVITNTALNTVQLTTSLTNHSYQYEECIIYPNPAYNSVIVTSAKKVKTIEVYSIAGKVVVQELVNNTEHRLDVSHLTNGIYFIKVLFTDSTSLNKKIVKQ